MVGPSEGEIHSDLVAALEHGQDLFCPVQTLPNELLEGIMQHLSLEDLLYCSLVNSRWFDVVSEHLQRTQACWLVKDQDSCENFNLTDKDTRQLILSDVNLCKCFSNEKVQSVETFYFAIEKCTSEDIANLRYMLRQGVNLRNVTLKVGNVIEILDIGELLQDLKQVKSICLIISEVEEDYRKNLMAFFNDCYYFYDEIIIQFMGTTNELIYVCSNKVTLHNHVQRHFTSVVFRHVSSALVENILADRKRKINHVEIGSMENMTDETLSLIFNMQHLKYLTLDMISNPNLTWGPFFTKITGGHTSLKELSISHCSNITNEDIVGTGSQQLNKLSIDFNSCPKITNVEQLLKYSLSHVLQLSVRFIYNKKILDNFLSVFGAYSLRNSPAISQHVNVEILRVNHCSKQVSDHIEEFKSSIEQLGSQCSVQINVGQVFTRICQNI